VSFTEPPSREVVKEAGYAVDLYTTSLDANIGAYMCFTAPRHPIHPTFRPGMRLPLLYQDPDLRKLNTNL